MVVVVVVVVVMVVLFVLVLVFSCFCNASFLFTVESIFAVFFPGQIFVNDDNETFTVSTFAKVHHLSPPEVSHL